MLFAALALFVVLVVLAVVMSPEMPVITVVAKQNWMPLDANVVALLLVLVTPLAVVVPLREPQEVQVVQVVTQEILVMWLHAPLKGQPAVVELGAH
jgi:hypothetical protein